MAAGRHIAKSGQYRKVVEKSFHKLFKGRAGLSDWYGVRSRFRNTPWIVETGGEDFCRTVRTFKTDTIPRIDTGIHSDTLAMADAVQVEMDFAAKHPDETLILVTGDHETGGSLADPAFGVIMDAYRI